MTPGRPDRSAMLTQVISTNVLKEKLPGSATGVATYLQLQLSQMSKAQSVQKGRTLSGSGNQWRIFLHTAGLACLRLQLTNWIRLLSATKIGGPR